MADLKLWAISLCAAALAGAIMHMIVPNTSLEKMMRLVIGVFFLSCIISPVLARLPDLDLGASGKAEQQVVQIQEGLLRTIDGQVDSQMKAVVRTLLMQKGIAPENISFEYNTADKNRISISQIDVMLSPEYTAHEAEIREYINGQTGITTILSFSEVP